MKLYPSTSANNSTLAGVQHIFKQQNCHNIVHWITDVGKSWCADVVSQTRWWHHHVWIQTKARKTLTHKKRFQILLDVAKYPACHMTKWIKFMHLSWFCLRFEWYAPWSYMTILALEEYPPLKRHKWDFECNFAWYGCSVWSDKQTFYFGTNVMHTGLVKLLE